MTVRAKAGTVLAVLVFFNAAVWGLREMLGSAINPLLQVLAGS